MKQPLVTYGFEIHFKLSSNQEKKVNNIYKEIEKFEKKLNNKLRKQRK